MRLKKLLLPGIALLLFSCKKNKETGYNCNYLPACASVQCIAFWSYFNFTIVDKTTGNNMLFGSNSSLNPADIKIFYKTTTQYEIAKYPDSITKAIKVFSISDTIALQIKNEPLKIITVKTFCSKECCSTTAVEIMYDGNLLVADGSYIFRIKR